MYFLPHHPTVTQQINTHLTRPSFTARIAMQSTAPRTQAAAQFPLSSKGKMEGLPNATGGQAFHGKV